MYTINTTKNVRKNSKVPWKLNKMKDKRYIIIYLCLKYEFKGNTIFKGYLVQRKQEDKIKNKK